MKKKYESSKNPLKERNQNLSRYYNFINNISSFNTSQNIHLSKKSSYKNRPIIIIIIIIIT
jgi:hypothetical protein